MKGKTAIYIDDELITEVAPKDRLEALINLIAGLSRLQGISLREATIKAGEALPK